LEDEVFNDPSWHYINHLGDLYRGFSVSWPQIRWSRRNKSWMDYKGKDAFKPIEWDEIVSEAEAKEIMAE
jgi:hypothetical protein